MKNKTLYNNPVIFKADTKYLHLRITSMIGMPDGYSTYSNLKIACFKTDNNNNRVDLAEFYMHYTKFRAMLNRIRYILNNAQAHKGRTMVFRYMAQVPGEKIYRNLEIRFLVGDSLVFIFNDGKQKNSSDKNTGSITFPIGAKYEKYESPRVENALEVTDQLQRFDEFISLIDTINTLELSNHKSIFVHSLLK